MTRFLPTFLPMLFLFISIPALSADSIFDFTENQVTPSPDSAAQLDLEAGENVIDFDVSP